MEITKSTTEIRNMNGRKDEYQGRELLRAIAGGAVQAGAAFVVGQVLKRVVQRKSAELGDVRECIWMDAGCAGRTERFQPCSIDLGPLR